MKLQKIEDYFTAKDIKEYIKLDSKFNPPKNAFSRITKKINNSFLFLGRYTPLPFEIDGVRRIIEGQYMVGTFELLFAEYVRFSGYQKTGLKLVKLKVLEEITNMSKSLGDINKNLDLIDIL